MIRTSVVCNLKTHTRGGGNIDTNVTYHRNYCTECNWSASTEDHSRHEVASLAIEHFIETHHTIESEATAEMKTVD